MAVIHGKSRKKVSGGKYRSSRKKRKYERGSEAVEIKVEREKKRMIRTRGGNKKLRLINAEFANLYNKNEKKYSKEKIIEVKKNKANKDFVRRNVVTKGAIIETEQGAAKVTSRPGQNGIVNAVLVE